MWRGIEGHDDIVDRFRRAVRNGRLASTYLFTGPNGIGKRMLARELATSLMCTRPTDLLSPCGECPSCELARQGNHPDLIEVEPAVDKNAISIDQLIGSRENRHREGLCHDIAMRPYAAARRVAIVSHADTLNTESANCLLKTLEEPPPKSILILLSSSESKQLPTIRSRCQIIRFKSLTDDVLTRLIAAIGKDTENEFDRSRIPQAVAGSAGSLDRALQLLDSSLWEVREGVMRQLLAPHPDAVAIATLVQQSTDSAGKEASERRQFLDSLLELVIDNIRQRSRAAIASGQPPQAIDAMFDAIDDSIRAIELIARNVHLANLIMWWSQRIAELARNWPQVNFEHHAKASR